MLHVHSKYQGSDFVVSNKIFMFSLNKLAYTRGPGCSKTPGSQDDVWDNGSDAYV